MNILAFDPVLFKDVLSGLQSLFVVLAIIIGGIWTLFTFDAFQTVKRARAELIEIEQKITEQAVINLSMNAVQATLPDEQLFGINITVSIVNNGNRIAHLVYPDAEPLGVSPVSFDAEGQLVLGDVLRAPILTMTSHFRAHTLQPGESESLQFFVVVKQSGLYFIEFRASPDPTQIALITEAVGSVSNLIWYSTMYFVVRNESTTGANL